MEHRCATRRPFACDVVLSYRALGFVQGRARDLSMGGMYVETGCIQLPVNAVVEASFMLEHETGQMGSCSTQAMVIHTKEGGSGLMFNESDQVFSHLLHDLFTNQSNRREGEAAWALL